MNLYHPAVAYYESGSVRCRPNPVPCNPATARPFVVRIGNQEIIPCNVIVFADDPEAAEIRLLAALHECTLRDHGRYGRHFAFDLIEGLDSGTYDIRSEPFDPQDMSKIQWAANDTL